MKTIDLPPKGKTPGGDQSLSVNGDRQYGQKVETQSRVSTYGDEHVFCEGECVASPVLERTRPVYGLTAKATDSVSRSARTFGDRPILLKMPSLLASRTTHENP